MTRPLATLRGSPGSSARRRTEIEVFEPVGRVVACEALSNTTGGGRRGRRHWSWGLSSPPPNSRIRPSRSSHQARRSCGSDHGSVRSPTPQRTPTNLYNQRYQPVERPRRAPTPLELPGRDGRNPQTAKDADRWDPRPRLRHVVGDSGRSGGMGMSY